MFGADGRAQHHNWQTRAAPSRDKPRAANSGAGSIALTIEHHGILVSSSPLAVPCHTLQDRKINAARIPDLAFSPKTLL